MLMPAPRPRSPTPDPEVENDISLETTEAIDEAITQGRSQSPTAIDISGSLEDEPVQPSGVAVGEKRKPEEERAIDGVVIKKKKRLCNSRKLCITIAKCAEPLESVKDALIDKIAVSFEYKFVQEHHKDGDLHVHGAIKAKECIQLYDNSLVIAGTRYGIHIATMSHTPWEMVIAYLQLKQDNSANTFSSYNFNK